MNILFPLYHLLFLLYIVKSQIFLKILQTSILHFIPSIKLHHIVLLSDNPRHHLYTLDFTPINQTRRSTLFKMLLGRNVPAEIRLRYIITNMENTDTIIEKWDNINKVTPEKSSQLTITVYNTIENTEIKNIIHKSFNWQHYMNLYNHNCQHFSHYVKNISYSLV
jgi:hypothetical protein